LSTWQNANFVGKQKRTLAAFLLTDRTLRGHEH